MNSSDPLPAHGAASPTGGGSALEAKGEDRERGSQAPFEVSQEPLAGITTAEPTAGYSPAPAYEHLGDLPPTYGSQSVYLVAYDPRQLFAYWDVDPGSNTNLVYGLRVCRADGEVETEVTINPREAGRYLAAGLAGGTYYVELGTTGRAGRWRPLAFSGRVTMPAAGLAGEVEPRFATLPFHLSFQRLLELIHDAMGQGENLTATLARLQAGDREGIDALVGTLNSLSQEQLRTLERLLGHQVDPRTSVGGSFGGGSENSALAAFAGGSETLSSAAFGSESLSSGAFGSETVSSAGFGSETAPLAAFGSETLGSGALGFGSETWSSLGLSASSLEILRGLGINSEAWSLASGAAGLHSETLSSDRTAVFFRGLEGNMAHLSSMFSEAFASLGSEFLSSESSSRIASGSL